jgi:hypothetical protein
MKLIKTETLLSAQSLIEFSSIPQDNTDLLVTLSLRSNRDAIAGNLTIYFNGISTNYSYRELIGFGTSTAGSFINTGPYFGVFNGGNASSNTFSNSAVYIPNYSGPENKTYSVEAVVETNGTTCYQQIVSGFWNNTLPINSISVIADSGTLFSVGTTVSIYGIRKGSDGIVTVS